MDMSRILVTGGAGFIGSHVVSALLDLGHQVIVVDDGSSGQLRPLPAEVRCHHLSLNKTDQISKILLKYKPKIIYHLAGHTQLRVAEKQPTTDAEQNILATLSLVEACLQSGWTQHLPKQLIFASSSAVYGGAGDPPFSEDTMPRPVNPYGIAKFAAEQYLEWFGRQTGVTVTNLRYANVYGPGQSSQGEAGVVAKFMALTRAGQPLPVYGDGSQSRDFIYISDIVQANLTAATKSLAGTYVIGTGQMTTALKIAQLCQALAKPSSPAWSRRGQVPVKEVAAQPHFLPSTVPEQRHSALDATRFRQLTGWQPQVELTAGLAQTWEWWCSHSRPQDDEKPSH